MRVIIKGRKGLKISSDLKIYIKEKIDKFEGLIPEPVICEVTLLEKNLGPKRGTDKNVHIVLTGAKIKKSIFSKVRASDFKTAIDLCEEKIEEQIIKYKEKKRGSRFPVKYWVSKVLETGASGPRWLLKKFRRKK